LALPEDLGVEAAAAFRDDFGVDFPIDFLAAADFGGLFLATICNN
jgi:hypothetical protein